MKKITVLTVLVSVGLMVQAYAAEMPGKVVANKICPVSHEAVGTNGMKPHTVIYKGTQYNLCCSMCEKDFNKDPEKYIKIIEQEAASAPAAEATKS